MKTIDLIPLKSISYLIVIMKHNYFFGFLNLKLWLLKLEFKFLCGFNYGKYNL